MADEDTKPLPPDESHDERWEKIRKRDTWLGRGAMVLGTGVVAAGLWGGCEVERAAERRINNALEERRAEEARAGALKSIISDLESNAVTFKEYDAAPLDREKLFPRRVGKAAEAPAVKGPEIAPQDEKGGAKGPEIAPPPRRKYDQLDIMPRAVPDRPGIKQPPNPPDDPAVVDIAKELSEMIVVQNAFAANTKPIFLDRLFREFSEEKVVAELEAMRKDPGLQPSVLVEQARRHIQQHLDEENKRASRSLDEDGIELVSPKVAKLLGIPEQNRSPLEKAIVGLELAETMIDIRKRPASVTEQQDKEMRTKLKEHIAELRRQVEHYRASEPEVPKR